MNFRTLAVVASVLAIAGCADTPPLPSAPDEVRLGANPGSNGVVQSINGNADIMTEDGLRRLEVHARRAADGTVSGTQIIRQEWETGVTYESEVTCFTIVGNKAYVGSVVTAVDGAPYVGHLALRVIMVDNGEGNGAMPDRSSRAAGAIESFQPAAFCSNASLVSPMYDLVRGNLQIRP